MAPDRARMARLFREQGEGCGRLGSPLYAGLLTHAGDDIDRGGVLATVLSGHEDDYGPSALALRLAGAVHRIVLSGRAPRLAAYYPSMGGVANPAAAWPEFRVVIAEHADEIDALLQSPPQTNEVGRSAILIGALLQLTAQFGLPIRLLEFGASAGLNLRADAFRYDLADGVILGDVGSPVVLSRPWAGLTRAWPPVNAAVDVVERVGGDPQPADPLAPDDQLRLLSYVWPDQPERIARLRAAFDVAARVPAPVLPVAAAPFLADQLVAARQGVLTVVWHSVVWQYLDKAERQAVLGVLAEAGERATTDAPLAHVAFEPVRPTPDRRYAFLGSLQVWPGDGTERVIAEGQGHGPPVVWS
ncbi:MAG: DUF2332 domain-containing protein [Actinomycetes bacterium]